MDRRQIKTRAAIFDALTNLLAKKRFTNITVQDIIDEANIGRSTFYSHFETKDDMLKAMCDEIFGHIFSQHPEMCGTYISHGNMGSLGDRLAHILHHIRDSKYRVNDIISCESGEIFLSFFKEYMKDIFGTVLSDDSRNGTADEGRSADSFEIPRAYLTDFYASAFAETVRWWLSSGTDFTPEQTASFFIAAAGLSSKE